MYPIRVSYGSNEKQVPIENIFKLEYLNGFVAIIEETKKIILELKVIDEHKLQSQDSFLQLLTNLKGKLLISKTHFNSFTTSIANQNQDTSAEIV